MKTRYTKVQLTRVTRQNYGYKDETHVWVRPTAGRRVMKQVGDCIAGGGQVKMETSLDKEGQEFADVTLHWGNHG